jgi:hypothetical protein
MSKSRQLRLFFEAGIVLALVCVIIIQAYKCIGR